MARTIHVCIVEDNAINRIGLNTFIQNYEGFEVAFATSNGDDLLNHLDRQVNIPEICMLDGDVPNMGSYKTLILLKEKYPKVKVLIFTLHHHEFNICKMLQKGADGYLSKKSSSKELHRALLSLYYTGSYHDNTIMQNAPGLMDATVDNSIFVTDAELQILKLFCTQMSLKEIADAMDSQTHTIEGYRDILFDKFDVNTRINLVVRAHELGLISELVAG